VCSSDLCLEAYFSWALATPENILIDHVRRRVALFLEGVAIKQFCGERWSDAEANCLATGGNYYDALVCVAMEHDLALHGDLPEVRPEDLPLLHRRLHHHFARTGVDLRAAVTGGADDSGIAERLDFAVMDAYEDIRKIRLDNGEQTFEEPDIANDPATWRRTINEAVTRHDMSFLQPFILPESRWEILRRTDYLTISDDEMIDIIESHHIDVSRRSGVRWFGRSDIRIALQFWISPRRAIASSGWRDTATKLLSDRQSARAIRYAALRLRSARKSWIAEASLR